MIHYADFIAAVRLVRDMDPGVLMQIEDKPKGTDRKADSKWRRLCRTVGISTTAKGVTKRDYHATVMRQGRRIAELTETVARLTAALGKAETEIAGMKVRDRVNVPTHMPRSVLLKRVRDLEEDVACMGAAAEWIVANLCDDCAVALSDAWREDKAVRKRLCVRCDARIGKLLTLASEARAAAMKEGDADRGGLKTK